MSANMIPIEYFVGVQATAPQLGLGPLQISTILLLTDEEPTTSLTSDHIFSRTASNVANTWGTQTETAAQANAIFSQQPNILVNNGYLIVAPYQTITTPAQSATAGTLTTPDISENIANFTKVTDGDLTISINGAEAQELTELDFSEVETLEAIATVIQDKLSGATISVANNALVFVSSATGATSSVEITQTTEGAGTDIYGETFLNIAQATETQGTDATPETTQPETLAQAITRLSKQLYFEGILTTRDASDSEYITAANSVLNKQILMIPRSQQSAITGIFQQTNTFKNVKNIYYGLGSSQDEVAQNARLFAAAYLSRALAVNYSGSNTTLTMNLKNLSGISADTTINETLLAQLKAVGADCYPSVEGLAKVVSNPQNGEYFDQLTNRIWFVNTILREVFNTIATIGTKVAQTETGLQIIADVIQGICNQAVANGYLAPGTWNSADTFGNYEDFMRNIREYGFYQYHQPISQQLQSEREERRAPFWQVAGKEAGAIHGSNIIINIEA